MPNTARHTDTTPRTSSERLHRDPIDFSVPYKSRVKGASRHYGLFPFFAKKPWPVVQEYIRYYTSPGDLVCDPFCGSGVTPVESLVLDRRAIASDINPVARFITRMTAVAPVDLDQLRVAYEHVRSAAQERIESLDSMSESELQALLMQLDYPRIPIPRTVRRRGAETVDQLHTPRQLAGLTILRDAINQIEEDVLRDLLRLTLAATVRYTNKTYVRSLAKEGKTQRAPYAGDAGFLRRFSYSLAKGELFYEHTVWPTFARRFNNLLRAKEETNNVIGSRYNPNNFILGDTAASRIHELTGEGTVDYCFTDPPYSNQIHFLDLSVLWAAWLGLEITPEIRSNEMMIRDSQEKSRRQFEEDFAASMESIARALKQDRWFTLVYKHRDLSLWQNIVAACEKSGLRYINSVWQDLKITSKRQLESPDINPKGDMYLNFRKMSQQKFNITYPSATVIELPTIRNYVEKEIERIIVSYLGADIKLITSEVIRQILDSRAFKNYHDNPKDLTSDIQTVLKSPRFSIWKPHNGTVFWIMNPQEAIDATLPTIDRARYYVFQFLREEGEATESKINTYLLTRFSKDKAFVEKTRDIDVSALLRNVGREITPHHWQLDVKKVSRYKQLRLFFQPSKSDEIRERVEDRVSQTEVTPLRPNFEGITLLLDRLHGSNMSNDQFEPQVARLLDILNNVFRNLISYGESQIEQVLAIGEWAQYGIDLRNAAFENILLQIIWRSVERPFSLYNDIAEKVFSNLSDEDMLVQFRLLTLPEWEHAVATARLNNQVEDLGVPLLNHL